MNEFCSRVFGMKPIRLTRLCAALLFVAISLPYMCEPDQLRAEVAGKAKHPSTYPATPLAVVAAFVKSGFEPKSIEELAKYGDVSERWKYISGNPESGFDCLDIALAYKLVRISQSTHEARIRVIYDMIGYQCCESFSLEKKEKAETYYLEKRAGYWRIYAPFNAPVVSTGTCLKVWKRCMVYYPDRRNSIERSISVLKKYLRILRTKPKGTRQ